MADNEKKNETQNETKKNETQNEPQNETPKPAEETNKPRRRSSRSAKLTPKALELRRQETWKKVQVCIKSLHSRSPKIFQLLEEDPSRDDVQKAYALWIGDYELFLKSYDKFAPVVNPEEIDQLNLENGHFQKVKVAILFSSTGWPIGRLPYL